MINLLPSDYKTDISFGRRNTVIVKWLAALWAIIAGLVAITFFGQFYIGQSTSSLQSTLKQSESRIATQKLDENQKNLEALNNNFKITSQLLGKQLVFSDLFVQLGKTLPKDTVVSQIALTDKIAGGEGVAINIRAKSKESANQAFVNISDPNNNLFEDADLLEITVIETPEGTAGKDFLDYYPYSANIQAKFKPNSQFILLNKLKAAQ